MIAAGYLLDIESSCTVIVRVDVLEVTSKVPAAMLPLPEEGPVSGQVWPIVQVIVACSVIVASSVRVLVE